MAIHELGHASVLPQHVLSHVSFLHPCPLCEGDEGKQQSGAHTGYPSEEVLPLLDEILYSLAGGAAEVACGLSPELECSEFGSFPSSMGNDLRDLGSALPKEIWDALIPVLPGCFKVLTSHFESKSTFLWKMSRSLRESRSLTSNEMDFRAFDRDELMSRFKRSVGLSE
jgi:hypothetical protein